MVIKAEGPFGIRRYRGEEEQDEEAVASSDDELPKPGETRRKKRKTNDLSASADGDDVPKSRKEEVKKAAEETDIDVGGTSPEVTRKKRSAISVEEEDVAASPTKKKKRKKSQSLGGERVAANAVEESAGTTPAEKKGKSKGKEEKFTVINPAVHAKKKQVRRVLPDWLAKPTLIEQTYTDLMPVEKMTCLDASLLTSLKENGIETFFPVQQVVIPALSEAFHETFYRPRDVCVSAPTGSGKTLAFVLPIVNALKGRVDPQVRALVVLPKQELAKQVFGVFRQYAKGTNLKVVLLQSDSSFVAEQQQLVRRGVVGNYLSRVDILVCTPGRLMMHIASTPGFTLQHVRYFVMDEADGVMDSVDKSWLHQLELALRGPRASEDKVWDVVTVENLKRHARLRPYFPQKLLFSATLSQNPQTLEEMNLFMPRLFTSAAGPTNNSAAGRESTASVSALGAGPAENDDLDVIGKYTTPLGLKEFLLECDSTVKPLIVHGLLTRLGWKGVLCFVRGRESSRRLCKVLDKLGGVSVGEFSSLLTKVRRKMMLEKFARGVLDVLVTSDAMARGIDLPQVNYVVCYDRAPFVTTYIHRVGRTARAGKPGTALSLLAEHEVDRFAEQMKTAGKRSRVHPLDFKIEDLHDMEDKYKAALEEVRKETERDESVKAHRKGNTKVQLKRRLVGKVATRRLNVVKKRL